MHLLLRRTPHAANVNAVPVALWAAEELQGVAVGVALIAEILPIPGPYHEVERRSLAEELTDEQPWMLLFPTAQLAQAQGAPARMWLGETGRGLKVAAFICAIQPINDAMDRLLSRELLVLPAIEGPPIPNSLLAINPAQALR